MGCHSKVFMGKYEAELKFSEGWGGGLNQTKPNMVAMDIFWKNTAEMLQCTRTFSRLLEQ